MTYLVCALTVYSIFKHRVQTAAAKVLKHLSGAIPPLDFERKNAQLFKKKHCLYVNSGSSALYIESRLSSLKRDQR